MSIRIRPSSNYYSQEQTFRVKETRDEVHDAYIQQIWDEENRIHGQDTYPVINSATGKIGDNHLFGTEPHQEKNKINDEGVEIEDRRCFLMRSAAARISSSYFVVEYSFLTFSYSFKLQRYNDVVWWAFSETGYSKSHYLPQLGSCIRGGYVWNLYIHDFFHDHLIVSMNSKKFNRFERILRRLESKLEFIMKDPNYTLRIYLESTMINPSAIDAKYIEIYVAGDTKLVKIFEVLGGWRLHKEAALIQHFHHKWNTIGKRYTLMEALSTEIQVKDLGWIVEGGVIWLLPTPFRLQEYIWEWP